MSTFLDKYKFNHCIGKGNFGDVYKAAKISDSTVVAIKIINLDETTEEIKVVIQEIQFLSRLKNKFITRYIETFVNDVNMFIVMEYCGGGSCADILKYYKKLSEDLVCFIIRDVLKGLTYLHQENKVHRDIKLANILLTDFGEVKLADFGVSGEITLTHLKRKTFVGTPFWMAPEVITRRKDNGYDEKADIWSAGITTIELVTGSPPLSQYDPMKILFEIPKKRPPLLVGMDFSENIKDFVKYCLIKEPKKRPSANTLLHHHFITGIKNNTNSIRNLLIKMIKEKNEMKQALNKVAKKPRHKLLPDVNVQEQKEKKLNWDFGTFKSIYAINLIKNTHKDDKVNSIYFNNINSNFKLKENVDSQNLNQKNSNFPLINSKKLKIYDINKSNASISLLAASSLSNGALKQTMHSVSIEHSISDLQNKNVKNSQFKNIAKSELLFYCLEQVYHRGRSEGTKQTVHNLINNLLDYEMQQPGLCEAIMEELFHFK